MPTIYKEGKLAGLNQAIGRVGQFALQKQLQDIQRQQELQDAVKKAVITSVLSGKGKFKTPVDINQIISGGQMPNLSEFQPISTPTTSISISEIPYSERLQAREIGARSPEEWYKLGMATGKGQPEGGWLFGLGNKGYVEDINKIKKPIHKEYILSPEAQAAQTEAAGILKSPYRTTKRLGYRGGDIMDTTFPDASEYEEGTVVQMDNGSLYKVVNGQWVIQE